MFSLVLAGFVVAAAPCVVIDGKPVCGEMARDLMRQGLFPQTPHGKCSRSAGGKVLCFDPPKAVIRAYENKPPAVTCLWQGERGACGYDCKHQGDEVACAKTPRGTCLAQYDRVVCADPPNAAFGVFGAEAPKPSCTARQDAVSCGYGCAFLGEKLACAKTPFGRCAATSRGLLCFDPSEEVICAYGKSTPAPSCDLEGCGYNCKANVCTQTPGGSCDHTLTPPLCVDPPLVSTNVECTAMLVP